MTLDRYNALQRFWRKWPPIQVTMANYVGYKPPAVESPAAGDGEVSEEMDDESMAALVSMFGPLPVRKRKGEDDGQD